MSNKNSAGPDAHRPAQRWVKWLTTEMIDVVVGTVMTGLFFYMHSPQLGELAAVVTILFAAQKYSIRTELKQSRAELNEEMRPLLQLRQAIDIGQASNIPQVDEILKEYLRITDHEFRSVKDNILLDAIEGLRRLSHQKTSGELAAGEYYAWLLPMIPGVRPNQRITAVSVMQEAEWDDSEPERKFIDENEAAAKRGVFVERIFVMPRDIIDTALRNEAVCMHMKERGTGLNGFVIIREDLEARDPELLRRVGDGFFKISDSVALVDKFGAKGEVRGYVTKNAGELHQLDILFGQLKVHAKPLSVIGGLQGRPALVNLPARALSSPHKAT